MTYASMLVAVEEGAESDSRMELACDLAIAFDALLIGVSVGSIAPPLYYPLPGGPMTGRLPPPPRDMAQADPERALENTRFWAPLSLTAEQKHSIHSPAEMERAADELPIEQVAKRWVVASRPEEVVEALRVYTDLGFDHLVVHGPGQQLAACFIDLDHFKRVNDEGGHRIGDQLLVAVAQRLLALDGHGRLIGRLGGEEFALLLPSTDLEGAFKLAERFRTAVESQRVMVGRNASKCLRSIWSRTTCSWRERVQTANQVEGTSRISARPRCLSPTPCGDRRSSTR